MEAEKRYRGPQLPVVCERVRCQAGLAIYAATKPFNGRAKATMKELVPPAVQRRLRNFNPPDMGRSGEVIRYQLARNGVMQR
jgi:hypothetical protein